MRGHPASEKGSAGPTTGTGWEHLRTWGWVVSPGSAFQVPALELGAGPEVGTVHDTPQPSVAAPRPLKEASSAWLSVHPSQALTETPGSQRTPVNR